MNQKTGILAALLLWAVALAFFVWLWLAAGVAHAAAPCTVFSFSDNCAQGGAGGTGIGPDCVEAKS
jgi:hypothetical protein